SHAHGDVSRDKQGDEDGSDDDENGLEAFHGDYGAARDGDAGKENLPRRANFALQSPSGGKGRRRRVDWWLRRLWRGTARRTPCGGTEKKPAAKKAASRGEGGFQDRKQAS